MVKRRTPANFTLATTALGLSLGSFMQVAEAQQAKPQTISTLLSGTRAAGQRGEWCGTVKAYKARLKRQALSALGGCPGDGPCDSSPALRNSNIPNANSPWLNVRIYFNILAYSDGTEPCASAAKVDAQLAFLNNLYAPMKIKFVSAGTRFVRSDRFRDLGAGDAELVAMKNFCAFSPQDRLNVFVLNLENHDPTLLGQAVFPSEKDAAGKLIALSKQGGFVCDDDAFGAGGSTTPHEIGHCVGLLHTHAGTTDQIDEEAGDTLKDRCTLPCAEFAGRSVSLGDITGDFCSDTPAEPVNFVCKSIAGTDPCNGKAWGITDFHNIMSYTPDACQTHFTAQQAGRSRCWIKANLTPLLVPSAQFTAATYNVTEGTASAVITLSRVGSAAAALSVNYSATAGTATTGADFTARTGTVSWAAGNAADKTITVPIVDDAVSEPAETIRLALSSPVGGSLGQPGTATLSILDNESCTAPTNLLKDSTFEAGDPWAAWTIQTSTVNATPLCNGSCGADGTTAGPQTGANWAWFGGTDGKAEVATLGQKVVIPAGRSVNLSFALKVGQVTAPYTDVLRVKVDGAVVFTQTEPSVAQTAYKTYSVNLSSYANGAAHTILFENVCPAGGGNANFNVDNVYLNACPAATVASAPVPLLATNSPKGVSSVELSTLNVRAGADSIELTFTGGLSDASAADSQRYAVTSNGQTVWVEEASYLPASNRVVLSVPIGSVLRGDKVTVTWSDLRDADNRTLSGQASGTDPRQ